MKWLLLIILSTFISTNSLDTDKRAVVVKPNQSAQEILTSLQTSGLIRSVNLAKIYLKLSGEVSVLKPGVYYLSPNQKFTEIIDTISRGPTDIRVTVPEGWRREQIAQLLDKAIQGQDRVYSVSEFMQASASLEGRLFPDTYFLSPTATSAQIIKTMTSNFDKTVGKNVSSDALIIASLVERESRIDDERGIIAGILWKRYKNNWALQVDATVQYAIDSAKCRGLSNKCEWWKPITDTKFLSAFNTYTHPGLPPSPIGNPGLASIRAAVEPVESAYWFYLHDEKGAVHFAKTLEEHNLNVDKYLIN